MTAAVQQSINVFNIVCQYKILTRSDILQGQALFRKDKKREKEKKRKKEKKKKRKKEQKKKRKKKKK